MFGYTQSWPFRITHSPLYLLTPRDLGIKAYFAEFLRRGFAGRPDFPAFFGAVRWESGHIRAGAAPPALTDPRAFGVGAGRRYALATAGMLPEADDDGHAEESPINAESSDSSESSDSGESAIPPEIQVVENRQAAERKGAETSAPLEGAKGGNPID